MTTYTELRKISLEFRRLSSNLLRSGVDDSDVALSRLMKYIEKTDFIHDCIHSVIDEVEYDFRNCFLIENVGWNKINIPEDESEHLKAQYDYMNYIMNADKKSVCNEAMEYPHSSKKCSEIIQDFLDATIKPMIDYINDAISTEMIILEEGSKKAAPTVIQHVEQNYGTLNAQASGNITSSNNVSIIVNDINELLSKIIPSIDALNVPDDEKENIKDDLESISEQVQSVTPKKSRIKNCVARVKKFVDDFGMELAVSLATGAVTNMDWQQLILQAEAWLATLG